MKCVSYTRAGSCCKDEDKPAISIKEQNNHIKSFLLDRGLTISRKYCDRSKNPDNNNEFEKMRIDGQSGFFEMFISDSIWQCGKDIYQAVRVLKDVFYPAGIEFAIVQEDFCSSDHTKDEVNDFLDELWHRYSSYRMSVRMKKNSGKYHLDTFGYKFDAENDRLEIDEASAAVVKEIFDKLRRGMKPSEIGKELTERGVENPGDYRCRVRGWNLRGTNREWNEGTVYAIAKNPKFAGRWERVIEGKNYAADCDPIVDPDLFDEVQKLFDRRRHHKKNCEKMENPFLWMLTDEETGAKVIMKKNQKTGIYDFHFQPPKPVGVVYEKRSMLYDDAILKVRTELEKEKAMAEAAADYICSDEGIEYRESLIDQKRKTCKEIIAGLIYPKPDAFEKIEEDILDMQRIIIALSSDNPWIKLFLKYDESQKLTRKYLIRFVEHVYIRRFEDLKLVVRESDWKQMIPSHWMEG